MINFKTQYIYINLQINDMVFILTNLKLPILHVTYFPNVCVYVCVCVCVCVCERVCVFWFNVASNNFSVISRLYLVAV